MQTKSLKNLRESTIRHNQEVIRAYQSLKSELGKFFYLVPKGYIYDRISELTGYCTKKIATVINHYSEV